jgi:anti-sigma28 factor (negative regulator of flagellin synthesis)
MKIKGNQDAQMELERIRQQGRRETALLQESRNGSTRVEEDTVDVGLSRQIANSATERSERVAALKQLVQSGKYNPDMRAVAGAIDSTISEEVLFDKFENA